MECGVLNCPGPFPGSPHDFTQSPFLSYFATRELMYPSVMYVLPSESHATSVGWRNSPSTAGSGGSTFSHGLVSASADSFLRPKTISTRPAWLNLMIMSEPLSMAQMLSFLSMRTLCANDQP